MKPPTYGPVDRHFEPNTGATFTYRWGARSVGIDPLRQFGRVNGWVAIGCSLVFFLGGAAMFKSYGRTAWVPIGIGAATMLAGIGLLCQKRPDVNNAPIERLIRVWYDRGVIEFRYCPFFTSFWRQTLIDKYECPIEELKSFALATQLPWHVGLTNVRSSAILRIWTRRGYLLVAGEVEHLKALANAFETVAGERPAPLRWAMNLIIFVAATVIIATLWHFQII